MGVVGVVVLVGLFVVCTMPNVAPLAWAFYEVV